MSDASKPFRLAVLCDFPEEGWPSMDLVAEMLLAGLGAPGRAGRVLAARVCPPFRRRAAAVPGLGRRPAARNADRLANRLWDYPRYARRHVAGAFDVCHVADHSYAQLVHALPADRTGVFCHDLDAFRSLLGPRPGPRPRWFRAAARHVLGGMRKAAVVFYSTGAVRAEIERHGLVDPARLVQAPYGTAAEFSSAAAMPEPADELVGAGRAGRPFLLHVGSCIPRKRIDVLLDVFAAVREGRPGLHLVQVGGEWTADQQEQARRLGVDGERVQVRGLTRGQVASLYRRAAVVLQPSEAEGFGLPVVEALACGARVVASDIPVLREVGGPAAVYRPVGDVGAWAAAVGALLDDPAAGPPGPARLGWAARYSWAEHARIVLNAYLGLVGEPMVAT